jgi:hypothetical protein
VRCGTTGGERDGVFCGWEGVSPFAVVGPGGVGFVGYLGGVGGGGGAGVGDAAFACVREIEYFISKLLVG